MRFKWGVLDCFLLFRFCRALSPATRIVYASSFSRCSISIRGTDHREHETVYYGNHREIVNTEVRWGMTRVKATTNERWKSVSSPRERLPECSWELSFRCFDLVTETPGTKPWVVLPGLLRDALALSRCETRNTTFRGSGLVSLNCTRQWESFYPGDLPRGNLSVTIRERNSGRILCLKLALSLAVW